ncbi:MAG: leucyl aminopeptidase family protein [Pseudomonadota bacterium]
MSKTIPITLVAPDALEETCKSLTPPQATWLRARGYKAAFGSALALPDADGAIDHVLVGLGDAEARRRGRFVLGRLGAEAPAGRYRLSNSLPPEEAWLAALGWSLGQYRFTRYKQNGTPDAVLDTPAGVDPDRLTALVDGSNLTRDLINTPANDMGPSALEQAARDLAERHGAAARVVEGYDLLTQNFPLIHAVGRAAAEAPRLIDLTWSDGPLVTLVGKGVCFDTGGLNLKPGGAMGLMKKDMGGAATMLGLAHMIMAQNLPVRLRVLIPAVENSVSGPSMRPGDILPSRKGMTVEVNNTDAEGRLVLADALALACEEKPELLLDMATLTGAARVALGPDLPPFYTDDEGLASDLSAAALAEADPIWRMPLWPGYEGDIEPAFADLDNAPTGGFAGSITAALFLKRFVDTPHWAHFDIYGWAPKAMPGRPKGGECQVARAVFAMLERRYGRG